ncbi:hypothetical protein ACOSP7_008810 [Xanthoceras sorbifolium]
MSSATGSGFASFPSGGDGGKVLLNHDQNHFHGNSPPTTLSSATSHINFGSIKQEQDPLPVSRKRNLPGHPDPNAEVIALSPSSLMATSRFVCEVCHKGFQRDQNLQLHRRGHNLPWKLKVRDSNEIRKKVYVCPEPACVHHNPARALGDLTGIKKHYFRKHGEKKFECEKCSKKYAVLSDCKAHSKICRAKDYKCESSTSSSSREDSFIEDKASSEALAVEKSRASKLEAMANMVPPHENLISSSLPIDNKNVNGFSQPEMSKPKNSVLVQQLLRNKRQKPLNILSSSTAAAAAAGSIFLNRPAKVAAGGGLFGAGGSMSATGMLQKAADRKMGASATAANDEYRGMNSPWMMMGQTRVALAPPSYSIFQSKTDRHGCELHHRLLKQLMIERMKPLVPHHHQELIPSSQFSMANNLNAAAHHGPHGHGYGYNYGYNYGYSYGYGFDNQDHDMESDFLKFQIEYLNKAYMMKKYQQEHDENYVCCYYNNNVDTNTVLHGGAAANSDASSSSSAAGEGGVSNYQLSTGGISSGFGGGRKKKTVDFMGIGSGGGESSSSASGATAGTNSLHHSDHRPHDHHDHFYQQHHHQEMTFNGGFGAHHQPMMPDLNKFHQQHHAATKEKPMWEF